MALETGTYISDLVITNPTSTDPKSEGDNHLRLIKSTLKATFPNVTGEVSATHTQLNTAGSYAGAIVGRNKIINGKMEVAQRGTSFPAIAVGAYSLDRWLYNAGATTAVATVTSSADVPSSNELQNSLRFEVTTADASIAAGEYAGLAQRIEGFNARDLIGRTFTLSFWVRSSKTGIHCASFKNGAGDRTYVAEYTISAANTWEQKTITVSSGLITAGTWSWTTGTGLEVSFLLASGPSFHTTANAWQTGNFLATANQVNCLDTIGNIFAITGVQLEVGSVATPFDHRPYGLELALCQRYYYRVTATSANQRIVGGYATGTTTAQFVVPFPVTMRIAPTALEQSGTAAHHKIFYGAGSVVSLSAVPVYGTSLNTGGLITCTVAAGFTLGQGVILSTDSADAYLGWSAEL